MKSFHADGLEIRADVVERASNCSLQRFIVIAEDGIAFQMYLDTRHTKKYVLEMARLLHAAHLRQRKRQT